MIKSSSRARTTTTTNQRKKRTRMCVIWFCQKFQQRVCAWSRFEKKHSENPQRICCTHHFSALICIYSTCAYVHKNKCVPLGKHIRTHTHNAPRKTLPQHAIRFRWISILDVPVRAHKRSSVCIIRWCA